MNVQETEDANDLYRQVLDKRFPTRSANDNLLTLAQGHRRKAEAMRVMGFDEWRPGQEEITNRILACRDVLCILATGGGKTACFVIPSLCMDWPTIVFSPLQALMRDQVYGLQQRGIRAGRISADQNENLNNLTLDLWMRGELQFIYVAPERVDNEQFQHAMRLRPPQHMVVDEAHCLAQWSTTFRAAYRKLGDFARQLDPQVISAFTATLPPEAEQDIRDVLGMANAKRMHYFSRRNNLILSSEPYPGDEAFVRFVLNETSGPTLVYCTSVKRVEELAAIFAEHAGGAHSTFYHGKLSDGAKAANMERFMRGVSRICVATNAFGMGIDKADIRWVVHRDIPGTPEALSQEIGRAGRDGEVSYCRLFMDQRSVRTQEFFIDAECPDESTVRTVYSAIYNNALLNDGVCNLNNGDLARACGFEKDFSASNQVSTVLTLLVAHGVISKFKEKNSEAAIEFFETPSTTPLFRTTRDTIYELGIANGEQVNFSLVDVAEALGVPEDTLKSRLRQWSTANQLRYYPPANTRPIRVIGDIEALPWQEVRDRRIDKYKKLELVKEYARIPDDKKHAHLEQAVLRMVPMS